jgi:flavin-dependent dehydrogenase
VTSTRGQLPVIAIGGGLAGAAFALELARNGYRVIVLERSRGPRHTVCGEFLSEEAQVVLDWFGLNPVALGATTVSHLRLVKGERQATTLLPFKGNGLSRFRLDETLLGAAERAGAEVVRGALVTGVDCSISGLSVKTQEKIWKASAVALGTGKHPLRGFWRPASSMVGFKLHLDPTAAASEAFKGVVQLVFFRGGYVGACLVEDGILSVAWVMQASLVRAVGADWERQSAFLGSQSSFIARLIARAQPRFAKPVATASIPYGFLATRPLPPNVFAIGDQLAVVPSFTGDGMAIALYSGLAAARALMVDQSANAWQRGLIGRLRPQFRLAATVSRFLETPATCGIGIAVSRLLPPLVRGVVSATRVRGFSDIVWHR